MPRTLKQQYSPSPARTGIAALCVSAAALSIVSTGAAAETIRDLVLAHRTDVHSAWFVARETVRIALRGDGDTDLDLYVRSPSGTWMCREVGTSDREFCTFTAPETGVYRIEVRNLGGIANAYQLRHNG
jgi:hypothetical protein